MPSIPLEFIIFVYVIVAIIPLFPCYFYYKNNKIGGWKVIITVCFSFFYIMFASSLSWNENFSINSGQYYLVVLGTILGGFVASFYIDTKTKIIWFIAIFCLSYCGNLIFFATLDTPGWNWYIKLPLNICDITKIFLLIWLILFIFDKKMWSCLNDFIICFMFFGGIAYDFAGLHWGESITRYDVFETLITHSSYISISMFFYLKGIIKPNTRSVIINISWIALLMIPTIFLNQIYNYYFLFTWKMFNHWKDGNNPLNLVYDMFVKWHMTFNIGSYKSLYTEPPSNSLGDAPIYGQKYQYNINIPFYLTILLGTYFVMYFFISFLKMINEWCIIAFDIEQYKFVKKTNPKHNE